MNWEASHNELTRLRGLAMRVLNSAEDLREDIDKLIYQRKLEEIENGILSGNSVRQIAKNLDIPKSTIHDHIKRLSR